MNTLETPSPLQPAAATQTPDARRHAPLAPRKPLWRPIMLIAIGVAAIAWGARVALHTYHYEETDDAYVTGHLYQISPQVGGQVQGVLVDDNEAVKAGDVLVRLDPLQFQLAAQKARDQLVQIQAQEAETRAAVVQADTRIAEATARGSQAEAQLGQTEAGLNLAKLNVDRNERLFAAGGIISQSGLDDSRSAFRTAEAAHTANRANLVAARAAIDSARAARNSFDAQVGAAAAGVAVAKSAVSDAERMLAYTLIVAPADGRVGNKAVEPGNHVAAGQTLMALASPDAWVIANFKETQLTRMMPGQPVELTIDIAPGLKLHGTVKSLSPASGSQFALLPPDNATGNFNKVVQRVPVKIVLDPEDLRKIGPRLRLGLSSTVDVRVR